MILLIVEGAEMDKKQFGKDILKKVEKATQENIQPIIKSILTLVEKTADFPDKWPIELSVGDKESGIYIPDCPRTINIISESLNEYGLFLNYGKEYATVDLIEYIDTDEEDDVEENFNKNVKEKEILLAKEMADVSRRGSQQKLRETFAYTANRIHAAAESGVRVTIIDAKKAPIENSTFILKRLLKLLESKGYTVDLGEIKKDGVRNWYSKIQKIKISW